MLVETWGLVCELQQLKVKRCASSASVSVSWGAGLRMRGQKDSEDQSLPEDGGDRAALSLWSAEATTV